MANPEHLAKLKEGRKAWNAWRKKPGSAEPDLSGVSLAGIDLSGFFLASTKLSGADLTGVRLVDTKIYDCSACDTVWTGARLERVTMFELDARGATFDGAFLQRVTFDGCFLHGTCFDRAIFSKTTFLGSILKNASFTNAELTEVTFADTHMGSARGLETAKVLGISIGIDTFFQSGGLSDDILRMARTPEEFISYASSLVGKPIEYYSCFISYSGNDDEFAHRLHDGLQGKKIRTWFAPEDLKIGDRFRSRIDESIRIHDKLVLILSEHSINSAWVRREVETALDREDREKRDVLFPIRVDDTIFRSKEPWADEIRRTRHIGDFCNWKNHDDYTKAFKRLVKDLKKEGPIIMKA